MRSVSILGAGHAGRALGRLAHRAGYRIEAVVCRRKTSALLARRFIGSGTPTTDPRVACDADVVILAVPDDTIEPITRHLRFANVALHLCGSYSSKIIHHAPHPASLHPIRSFADPGLSVRAFRGTFCSFEGDRVSEAVCRRLILDIGGIPLRVNAEAKPLYHAATVFAANYVVTVLSSALDLMKRADVPQAQALRAIAGLAEGVLRNVRGIGLPGALTGPIERGDARTILLHLNSLARTDRRLLELYRTLARGTVRVARAKGTPERLLRRILQML